ncbi:MMPL family transporter [candidate division KSB1 bacterium]|nr:MMPL family transporter [candidate division KSB1 bacterium]
MIELLPSDQPSIRNLEEISKKAGGIGYLTIAIEGDEVNELTRFADSLHNRIQNLPEILFIYFKNDLEFIRRYALLYVSESELLKIQQELEERIDRERAKLNPFYMDLLEEEQEKSDTTDIFQTALDKYAYLNREYLMNKDQDLLVILVKPRDVAANLAFTKNLIGSIESHIHALTPETFGKGVNVSLSGRYASGLRDNITIKKDLRFTSILSAILIFLSLNFIFKKRRTFVVIGLPLVMGLSWAFGLTYLLIGELNLVTTFLVAILLGLGIDFGIHFFKRYLEFRRYQVPEEAVVSMITSAGVSSLTASLTTSSAFFSLIFTEFKGFHHFGIIAGFGIILTYLAYLLVFPSLIILWERLSPIDNSNTHTIPRIEQAIRCFRSNSGIRILAYVVVLLIPFLIFFSTHLSLEYDFHKLGSLSEEERVLKDRINNIFNMPLSPTIIAVGSPEEADRTIKGIKQYIKSGNTTLKAVQDIRSLVPTYQQEKIAIIKRIKTLAQDDIFDFLSDDKKQIFQQLKSFLDVEPLTIDKLPNYLTQNFKSIINPNEEFVLIYPAIELGNGKELLRYANDIEHIRIDGKPLRACAEGLVFSDILRLMARDGTVAIILTLFIIILIIWLDFRKINYVALLLAPIAYGMLGMFGIMGLFDIRFNFLNVVTIPVILGISVANTIHFLHRYMEERSLNDAFHHTGMAMFMTTLTTIIGFGSLIFARHHGLRTIGVVAVLGLTTNLVSCFIIMPLLIKLRVYHGFRMLLPGAKNGR